MINIIIFLFTSIIFALPMKKENVEEFLNAKYSGDTSIVSLYTSDSFFYYHAPYVGLGIKTHYVDGNLLVTKVINESLNNTISIGDRIHQFNGLVVRKDGIETNGPVGEIQNVLITKKADTVFSELKIPLTLLNEKENSDSFLNSIIKYSEVWYDYDLIIHDLISKKNKVFVHYSWEGSKEKKTIVYYFDAIEIFTIEKKTGLINKIESRWNELQFRDQFK